MSESAKHQVNTEQSEIVRDPVESGLNRAVEGFQRMSDQLSKMWNFTSPQGQEMARRSSQNIEAVSHATTILTRGSQEISHQWFELIQERLTKNLDAMNKLTGCRSLQDFVTVRTEIARERFGQVVESSRRMAEISVRVTGEAAQVIHSQAGRNAAEFPANVVPAKRVA